MSEQMRTDAGNTGTTGSGAPKAGPKEVALWLGAMIALYGSAISLLGLLYGYVDYLFPDPAIDYYYDPYGGPVRAAMAFLIVGVPSYLVLTGLLNRDLRTHPEKEDIWVRRWFVVATLFIAALTILIRLVGLVSDFLGGELQVRSLLKFVATVVVLGGGIAYYWEELRGRWRTRRARPIGIGVAVALVVTVVGGFLVIGSPAEQRDYRLDEQRINALNEITYQVSNYYAEKRSLPSSLDAIREQLKGYVPPSDPETGEPFVYRTTDTYSYQLCATFARATPTRDGRPVAVGYVEDYRAWVHPAGEFCFDLMIDPADYPPAG